MDTPLKKDGSKSQDLTENTKMDGQPQDSNAEAEENKSNHPNEEGKDDKKPPSEQVEEDKSKHLKKQNEDDTKQSLKTPELQEENEFSTFTSSSSWGKGTSDWKDDLSSFLTPEQSTTNFSSHITEQTDTDDLKTATWIESQLANPESQSESVPVCLWQKRPREWKEEERHFSIPGRTPSFHNRCGCSKTERLIKHSPLHLPKAPFHKNIIWKHQRPLFRGREICSPEKRLFKAVKRKKDHKAFTSPQMLKMLSSKGSSRQSKAMYNLYTTFCDEGKYFDPGILHGTKGLSRACTIFSAIRRGRIHVNYLLLTLHTLGILMSKDQMCQALQFIPIDAYGSVDFYDFLDVARNTLLYIDLDAFENVQRIFRTIKKDMIAFEELEQTLACLGVSLSPLIIEQTIKRTAINKDGKLNISEFLTAVKGLLSQHMHEYGILDRDSCQDFPTMDDSEVEWRRSIFIDKGIPLCYAHLIGLHEPSEEITVESLQKRTNKFQKPVGLKQTNKAADTVSMDEKDKKSTEWPKVRSKYGYTSHDTLFPLSSTLPLGESKMMTPQSRLRGQLKKPPVLPDLSLVPHTSTSSETLKQKKKKKKKLSFQEVLPIKQDLDEDTQETDAIKAESEDTEQSEDQSFPEAFQSIFDDIQMLTEDSIESDDLYSILNKLGIGMSDTEFQEILQNVDTAKDGTVNFNSFISEMEKMYFLSEFAILNHTTRAINKIEENKMVLHDLPSFIRNMGIQLKENALEEALKQVAIDSKGKIVVKDFIEILTRSPQFKELAVMKDTIQVINNIKEKKISLKDLKTTLQKMGIHLYPEEFEDLIQMVSADREGKADIEQVIEKIFKLQRFSDVEVLNCIIEIINQFKEIELNVSEVETSFNNIGIHLTKSELKQATETLSDSVAGETVDVKELISAMEETRRFKNYTAVLDCILALRLIKEHQAERLKLETEALRTIDLPMANQVIRQAIRSANITEAGEAKFNNFLRILIRNPQLKTSAALEDGFNILAKMKNERIELTELPILMQSFNINLPTEDMAEALAFCNVDDNNTLNLKEFIRNVIYTDTFVTRPELQLICLALSKFKDDHFDLQTLQSSLDSMELFRASELLKEVMNVAKADSYGKVNLEELIRVLTVMPEIPEAAVLMDSLDAMHNIMDHEVNVNDLAKTLTSAGINLTPDEMQSLCNSVTVTEDGAVNFNDIMKEIIGAETFEEIHALQKVFSNIQKILKEDIKKEDLLDALENLGSHLTPDDLQEVLAFASSDEPGKVHGMEFLKILSSATSISDIRALQNATKIFENVKEEKMTTKQLEDTLENMGVDLPSSTFNQILQTVRTDENDEIDFKEFLLALGETKDFTEMEALQRVIAIVGKMHGDQLHTNELQDTIDTLGLHLTEENIQEILYVLDVDADGTVNLKDFLMILPTMPYFMDSLAFYSAVVAFSKIKDGIVDPGELESILDFLGVKLNTAQFQNALKGTSIPGIGKFSLKDFLVNVTTKECFSENTLYGTYSILCKMDRDKVEISQMKDVLAAIGITLTKEQMVEALKNMTVDCNGMVNLKEFMKMLSLTQPYSSAVDMEKAMKTLKNIRQDKVEYEELDSIMHVLGLQLSQDEIQKAMDYVTMNADGTLCLKDFMFALTNNERFSEADRNRVPIKNLNSILEKMGISLTEEEMKKAFEQVTVEDGMVNLNEFTRNIKVLQELPQPIGDTEEKVAVEDIESLLSNLGVPLTKEQLQEALKNVTVDENEKVKMNELIESVVKIQRQAEMDWIHVNNLDNALINMGIYLTDDEIKEVLIATAPNEDGKVNLNDLMEGVKNVKLILSAGGEVVETGELTSRLTRMGLNITEEETQEALQPLTLDGNDEVDMKNVLQNIMLMKRPFKLERDKIDIQDLNRILTSAGIQLTEAEFQEALATTQIDIEGKVNLGEFIKSVRAAQPHEEETIAFLEEKDIIQEEEEEVSVEEEKVAASEEEEEKIYLKEDEVAEEEEVPVKEEKVAEEKEEEIPVKEEKVAAAEEEEEQIPVKEKKVSDAEEQEEQIPVTDGKVAATEEEQTPVKDVKVAASEEEEEKIPVEEEKVAPAEEEEEKIPVEEEKVAPAEEEEEKIPVKEEKVAVAKEEEEEISNEKEKTAAQEEEEKISIKEEKSASSQEEEDKEKIAAQEENVAVEELGAILANKGISLTDKELEEALIKAKVNVDGTVNLCNFFKAIHEIQGPPPDVAKKDEGLEEPEREKTVPMISLNGSEIENKIDIESLDEVLEEMGIHLTNRQLYEAFKHVSIDDDGKVEKKAFMESVNAILKDQPKDKRVDVSTLAFILADMGLFLTEEEINKVLEKTTFNNDMTVNLKEFMWAVDDLLSSQEEVSSSEHTLESSDTFLTSEEQQEDVTTSLTDSSKMSGDSNTFSYSSSQGTYPNKMPDAKMFKLPRLAEKSFQTPSRVFPSVTFNEEVKTKAVKKLSKQQLEAFRAAYDTFKKDLDGIIDQAALETTAHSLGINLTDEEVLDELIYADTDGDGKINFTDFLNIITDTKRFIQAVAPKKDDKETVDARGILFFELLSKLVESSKLPRNTTTIIVSYYRQKFLDFTGKKASQPKQDQHPSDKERLPRSHSSPIAAFAGAARICIMNEKELETYVANLQAKVNPSESPYNQVPIFPLIPNRDVLVRGKTMKDVQKLDVERKMLPLSSFEDHFLRKKRWIKQIPKHTKTSTPSLILSPDLSQKRLTMNDVNAIRQEVKKVTGTYRKVMALRERNKMLKLWKRLRGGEIGLETNNPSFYQIFSTYTWSWNVLQDLVSPRELHAYDKKQCRVGRAATPVDKITSTSGKSKRSQK